VSARGPWPLSWREFLGALGVDESAAQGAAPELVLGAAYDSRRVQDGDAFFALKGVADDGGRYARDADAQGAACVVAEAPTGARAEVLVGDTRKALALAARALYKDPSSRLRLIGLTGTNGKTTGAFLCRAILEAAGVPTGMVGTAGYWLGDERRDAPHTTPEAPDLCDLLDTMSARGLTAAVLEVSSHALTLRRAYGLTFQSVVFTNLTRDHLDFHGTEEAYLAAKLRLFDGENGGDTHVATAIVNASDPHASEVLAACRKGGMKVLRFALEGARGSADAELTARDVVLGANGTRFTIAEKEGGRHPIALPMPGRHNVENALAAWGATVMLGVPRSIAVKALDGFPGVPGRLEAIRSGQPFTVLVDFAHTPDALVRALVAVRETLAPGGRLAVVFGCGGDRDRGKRAAMGEAAVTGAHLAIVTDDNPRNENPAVIRGEAMKGAHEAFQAGHAPQGAEPPKEVAGRRRAIDLALAWARPGDAILIAGKGHEGVQIVAGTALPFRDQDEAKKALAALGFAGREAQA